MDKEWQINKTKSRNEDIPSVIKDKYEYMSTFRSEDVDLIVRCSFNIERDNKAGIFRFDLGDIDATETIVNAELYIYR